MFDQCLKILLILGSFSAVVRGEDYYNDVGYTTTTASATSRPTPTSMTTTSRPTRTRRSVEDDECYATDPNCDWKNDPSADQAWALHPTGFGAKRLFSYFSGFSSRGNNSIRGISPISRVDNHSCVLIHFQMHSEPKSGIVGLRVYQKPVHIALTDLIAYSDEAKKDYTIFEVWGDQGDYWHTKEFPLKHFDSNFQIIVEGIFGEDRVFIQIRRIALRTECTGNTAYPITKQTTSTTISTTTTMLRITTERPVRENGDTTTDKVMATTWPTTLPTTKQPTPTQTRQEGNGDTLTDKVTKSDTWVDSPPASPQSNPWSTTTWPTTLPTTKQPTTTPTLQKGNGCGDSRNPPIMLYLIAPGNSHIDIRVRPPCSASAASGALTN